MIKRRNINVNLSDEEHRALRHILLAEGESMAEFFGRCAKNYIIANRHKIPSFVAPEFDVDSDSDSVHNQETK